MKYVINYTEQGKILGFAKGDTDLNIEVSNAIWFEAQSYNKIIIDGENISFDKVDWRTPEEIKQETQAQFRAERNNLLVEADIEINKSVDLGLDSTEWRVYRQALRDSTLTCVLPSKPTEVK
jgi:hypothetical protein